jgi:molybdopterin converting factor small subunit
MSGSVPRVRVEFYGLARLRAGRAELWAEADTLREALAAADAACPELHALRDDVLAGEYLVSLGGVHFTADLNEPLADGDCVLVLGADAGG